MLTVLGWSGSSFDRLEWATSPGQPTPLPLRRDRMADNGSPATFSAKAEPLPEATQQDHIIRLLEHLIELREEAEGATPKLYPFEGDLAATGSAGDEVVLLADFPHDAWVVYFRNEANATLRIWPGSSIPGSGAIELRNGSAVRLKSTEKQLCLRNTGSATAHYFAFAVSLAEIDFYALA